MDRFRRQHASRCQSRSGQAGIPFKAPEPPTHAAIAELAYSYWEARGGEGGCAQDDWLRAERELVRRSLTGR